MSCQCTSAVFQYGNTTSKKTPEMLKAKLCESNKLQIFRLNQIHKQNDKTAKCHGVS